MSNPPSIRLLDHTPHAGFLIAWRKNENGRKEYLVEWVPELPGFRGGLGEPQQTWFPADRVERIAGEDYTSVPRMA